MNLGACWNGIFSVARFGSIRLWPLWEAVFDQVARFTSTSMGAKEIEMNGLEAASAPDQAEILLQQTTEALAIDIK